MNIPTKLKKDRLINKFLSSLKTIIWKQIVENLYLVNFS